MFLGMFLLVYLWFCVFVVVDDGCGGLCCQFGALVCLRVT